MSEETSSTAPSQDDESEFPPLPVRERPSLLALRPSSSCLSVPLEKSTQNTRSDKSSDQLSRQDTIPLSEPTSPSKRKTTGIKRPKHATDNIPSLEDSIAGANSSPGSSKKSRMITYREPTLLSSLDPDAFSLCWSQSSTDSAGPVGVDSPASSVYLNNNLGSLSDFIQQYSDTSLNSLSTMDMLGLNSPMMNRLPVDEFISTKNAESGVSVTTDKIEHESVCTTTTYVSDKINNNNNTNTVAKISASHTSHSSSAFSEMTFKASHTNTESQTVSVSVTDTSRSNNKGETTSNEKQTESSVIAVNKKTSKSLAKHRLDIPSPSIKVQQSSPSATPRKHPLSAESGDIKKRECNKNPGHQEFYLPTELKVKHLPAEIQHEDSLTFFTCMSELVVRITVYKTSSGRGPDDMYASYVNSGRKRYGSGYISRVEDQLTKIRCRRGGCNRSDDPDTNLEVNGLPHTPHIQRSNQLNDSGISLSSPYLDRSESNTSPSSSTPDKHIIYGGVYINTNKHIIFDKSEADSAYVQFFFNSPDRKGVFYGHVASITAVNSRHDRVTLLVMSHDKSLFDLVNMHLSNAKASYNQMLRSTHTSQQVKSFGKDHSWAAVISHAHGLAKTITCGYVRREVREDVKVIKYYDAPTCTGSSGGLVVTPSLLQLQWPGACHTCTDQTSGLNVTFDTHIPDLDTKHISRLNKPLLTRKDSVPDNIFSLS